MKEEIVKENTLLEKLDRINIEIMKMLVRAKSSLNIYDVISDNAKEINKIPARGNLWGFLQQMALDNLILNICKVFEKAVVMRSNQNSIERIIHLIKIQRLQPKYPEYMEQFLVKYAKEVEYHKRNNFTINDLYPVYKNFKEVKYEHGFSKLKNARDAKVAHNDATREVISTASLAEIEKILEFGYNFYATISEAYIGVGPIDIRNEKKIQASLEKILKQLGIVKII